MSWITFGIKVIVTFSVAVFFVGIISGSIELNKLSLIKIKRNTS